MPNAGTNLPGSEGIFVGWIVAYEENRLGAIKLVHRQQGIGGPFTTKGAQRGDQTGVVHSAVMVDVIGAEGGAGEPLEEIVFLVGGAIGADETDRVGAIFGMNFFQLCRGSLCGFFPGNWIKLVALAHHRLADALFMLGKIEAKAAFHAEKITVDAGKVAVVRAHDFVITHAERDLATVRAVCTSGGDVLHFPRTSLVAIRAAG